jgi:hypothetical protein
MAKRLEIKQPKPGRDGKTWWSKIGTAWVADNGNISLVFDALPLSSLNDKGELETRAMLMEPLERDAAPRATGRRPDRGSSHDPDLDDASDIPF